MTGSSYGWKRSVEARGDSLVSSQRVQMTTYVSYWQARKTNQQRWWTSGRFPHASGMATTHRWCRSAMLYSSIRNTPGTRRHVKRIRHEKKALCGVFTLYTMSLVTSGSLVRPYWGIHRYDDLGVDNISKGRSLWSRTVLPADLYGRGSQHVASSSFSGWPAEEMGTVGFLDE